MFFRNLILLVLNLKTKAWYYLNLIYKFCYKFIFVWLNPGLYYANLIYKKQPMGIKKNSNINILFFSTNENNSNNTSKDQKDTSSNTKNQKQNTDDSAEDDFDEYYKETYPSGSTDDFKRKYHKIYAKYLVFRNFLIESFFQFTSFFSTWNFIIIIAIFSKILITIMGTYKLVRDSLLKFLKKHLPKKPTSIDPEYLADWIKHQRFNIFNLGGLRLLKWCFKTIMDWAKKHKILAAFLIFLSLFMVIIVIFWGTAIALKKDYAWYSLLVMQQNLVTPDFVYEKNLWVDPGVLAKAEDYRRRLQIDISAFANLTQNIISKVKLIKSIKTFDNFPMYEIQQWWYYVEWIWHIFKLYVQTLWEAMRTPAPFPKDIQQVLVNIELKWWRSIYEWFHSHPIWLHVDDLLGVKMGLYIRRKLWLHTRWRLNYFFSKVFHPNVKSFLSFLQSLIRKNPSKKRHSEDWTFEDEVNISTPGDPWEADFDRYWEEAYAKSGHARVEEHMRITRWWRDDKESEELDEETREFFGRGFEKPGDEPDFPIGRILAAIDTFWAWLGRKLINWKDLSKSKRDRKNFDDFFKKNADLSDEEQIDPDDRHIWSDWEKWLEHSRRLQRKKKKIAEKRARNAMRAKNIKEGRPQSGDFDPDDDEYNVYDVPDDDDYKEDKENKENKENK